MLNERFFSQGSRGSRGFTGLYPYVAKQLGLLPLLRADRDSRAAWKILYPGVRDWLFGRVTNKENVPFGIGRHTRKQIQSMMIHVLATVTICESSSLVIDHVRLDSVSAFPVAEGFSSPKGDSQPARLCLSRYGNVTLNQSVDIGHDLICHGLCRLSAG